jgi:hypothetical protein
VNRLGARSVPAAARVAALAAIALLPLGWVLYFAKIGGLADRDTLDAIAVWTLVGTGALVALVLATRYPRSAAGALLGLACAVGAWGLDLPPAAVAFVYGWAVLAGGWLLARRRPVAGPAAQLSVQLRGWVGAVLVFVVPAAIALVAVVGLPSWLLVLGTFLGAVAAGTAARRSHSSSRRLLWSVALWLSVGLLVLEGLFLYDVYPLLPIALLVAGAFVAAIPYFLALTRGQVPPPRRPAR